MRAALTLYRVDCHFGPITTWVHVVEVWARDLADAHIRVRQYGYTPVR